MTQDPHLDRLIKRDFRSAPLSAQDRAMLEYAEKVATARWTVTPEDHERLRAAGFSNHDILDITLVVANFMLANTLTDAFGLEYHENLNAIFLQGEGVAAGEARPTGETWTGQGRPVIRALEGEEVVWLRGAPRTLAGLRGKTVLVYFWDWTHPGSLDGLPYLHAWHDRYAPLDAEVVLVLAPEFPFAKAPEAARRAVDRLEIVLPVVLDPRFRTWRGANNTFWPAAHLVDHHGVLVMRHHGSGGYAALEEELRRLLRARHPDRLLPEAVGVLHPSHRPGTRLALPTPQLYAIYEKGRFGNPEAAHAEGAVVPFTLPADRREGLLYVEGRWLLRREGLELVGGRGAAAVRYRGGAVTAVLGAAGRTVSVRVRVDGAPPGLLAGPDLRGAEVAVEEPGLYRLIDGPFGSHELRLEAEGPGLVLYQFTFHPAPADGVDAGVQLEVT